MKVVFYSSDIKEFIYSLSKRDYAASFRLIALLEDVGFRLSMPFSKKIGYKLYELRIVGDANVRIIYTSHNNTWILLHAFVKKTNRIPSKELRTAISRLRGLE